MQKPMTWKFWKGAETNTWARRGALIGGALGFFFGLIIAILRWTSPMENPQPEMGVTVIESFRPLLMFIPIAGTLIGAFAGALVGVGTPRFNPRPQQGGWVQEKTPPRDLKENLKKDILKKGPKS